MARVVSGVVLAAIFFALIWFTNATVMLVVALIVGALAVHEFVQMFRAIGADMHAVPTLLATWAVTILVPFPRLSIEVALSVGLVISAIWVMARLKPGAATAGAQQAPSGPAPGFSQAAVGVAAGALATIYIGLGLGALVASYVYGGRGGVLLLIATIIVSDTAQYYSGRTLGRRPLAPRLSPKKTLEGAIGGIVLAPLFLIFAAYYLLPAATNQIALALLAIALVIAGIAGDLFESMLKRAAGVKDSSALIPGHGGVLDRIDALLFAAPIYFLYLLWLFE